MQKRMIDAVETIPGVQSVGLVDSAAVNEWGHERRAVYSPTKRRI